MERVQRWWNGRIGVPGDPRRDLWLHTDGQVWRVRAQTGYDKPWERDYPDEATARAAVEVMMARTGDDWREIEKGRPPGQ